MQQIIFPQANITALAASIAICIIIPILSFVFYLMTKKAKLSSYFIGTGVALLIIVVGRTIVDMFFLVLLGLNDVFSSDIHPVYSAIYAAVVNGFLIQFSTYIALRFTMGDRIEKENMFFMTMGKAGLYCIIYGGFSSISQLAIASAVNGMGVEAYLSNIEDATDKANQAAAIALQAAEPAYQIVLDALSQIAAMGLHIALGVLVYTGLHEAKDILTSQRLDEIKKDPAKTPPFVAFRGMMLPTAIVLQILSYLPIFLLQMEFLSSIAPLVIVVDIIYMVVVSIGCYQVYKDLR